MFDGTVSLFDYLCGITDGLLLKTIFILDISSYSKVVFIPVISNNFFGSFLLDL